MSVVPPDLHYLDPAVLTAGHVVRVTDSPIHSVNDVYGLVVAIKRYPSEWRIRWAAAVAVGEHEPDTGLIRIPVGELLSCISREQWRRLPPRIVPTQGAHS